VCIRPKDLPINYWEKLFGKLCKMVDDVIHSWSMEVFFFGIIRCKLKHVIGSTIKFSCMLCLRIASTMSMGKETSKM
jgi:hypothetical protein